MTTDRRMLTFPGGQTKLVDLRSQYCPDRKDTLEKIDNLPQEWRADLYAAWGAQAKPEYLYSPASRSFVEVVDKKANNWLAKIVSDLNTGAMSRMLGHSDSDIVEVAIKSAQHCRELRRLFKRDGASIKAMWRYAKTMGLTKLPPGKTIQIKMRRFLCEFYWRRQLRKIAARITETTAQKLGWVSRERGAYVSHIALRRRLEQIKRNNETLERIKLFSEDGMCKNLREIAEHTLANKTIRRGELMLRARGFEEVAADLGHTAIFVTLTCPSRFHAMRITEKGKVETNPSWDKSTPKDAQTYLTKTWARIRAALARRGRTLYGIRVAEPHHDGCPHWHMLLFAPEAPDSESALGIHDVMQIMYEYALMDTPDEPGAWKRRIDFVRIQPESGSASGYIAKYLAKNLDGAHIEEDLLGNPALIAAQRVDAWASTWGIRQFQQLGGAPVTVWRELRRCEGGPKMQDAPDFVKTAYQAVNTEKALKGAGRASWAEYIESQGGPTIGRKAKIKLWKKEQKGVGQYGDSLPPRIAGIRTEYTVTERFGIIPAWPVVKEFFLASMRKVWIKYKTFDIAVLSEYVSHIVKRRSTQGDINHGKKGRQNKLCALSHNSGIEGEILIQRGGGESYPVERIRGEKQKRNNGRSYFGLLRLYRTGLPGCLAA